MTQPDTPTDASHQNDPEPENSQNAEINEFISNLPEKIKEQGNLTRLVLTYDRRRYLHSYYLDNSPWLLPRQKVLPTITRATATATPEEHERITTILNENSEWIPYSVFQWACETLNEFSWTKLNEVNALSRRGRKPHRINFPDAYVDATSQILELITKALEKTGSDAQLPEPLRISRRLMMHYRLGWRRPSLDELEAALRTLELGRPLVEIIDGLKLYSLQGTMGTIKARSRIDATEAYLVGYHSGDGSNIATKPWLGVSCQDRQTLEEQWSLWKTTYDIQPTANAQILKDHESWQLFLRNAPLRHFLTRFRRSIPGPAAKVRDIPAQIATGDSEVAKAYLAATIDSEGNIRRYPSGVAAFQISTASLPFAIQVMLLLWRLGYRSLKVYNPANEYQVQISKSEEVAWILYDTLPYLKNRVKIEAITEILGAKDYLETVRLKRTQMLVDLLSKAVTKCQGPEGLQRQSGIQKQSVWRWLRGAYETIPLTAVIKCCEVCTEQLLNYVDPKLSALLWLQGLMHTEQLAELRGGISPQILEHATNLSSPSFSEPVPCQFGHSVMQLCHSIILWKDN